ncbi:hypothetical protein SPAN111604_08670 [Sphingomonas antarctica]|uniref:hypothetical protein n=1 Tax=Sphingomonas antarctica TaxID=2040274 RepID=UPI0039E98236
MTHFWKWLAGALLASAVIYAGFIALSAAVMPWSQARFDTDVASTSQPFWTSETRYLVINKAMFRRPANRVIILGASNTREAFRPALVEAGLSGWEVSVAGFGSANMSELSDAADLIYGELGSQRRDKRIFVIGTHYLAFIPSNQIWPGVPNPVAVDAQRAGLFTRERGALVPAYPVAVERAIEAALRPQAMLAHVPRLLGQTLFDNPAFPQLQTLGDKYRGNSPAAQWGKNIESARDLNQLTVTPAVAKFLLAERVRGFGGDHALEADQFMALDRLITKIRAHGDAVIVVDLAIPRWHSEGVPLATASYRAGIGWVRARHAADSSVDYLSLHDLDDSDNFFDSTHTKPRMWKVWSDRLAYRLNAGLVAKSR